jgi:hypothetical protein
VIFKLLAYPTPKKVFLELLNAIGHTNRNGKEGQEVRREIGEGTLDEGNPATLEQI